MKRNRIKESVSDRIFNAVILFIVILINAIYIFPLLFVVFASVSDPAAVWNGEVYLYPVGFNLSGYKKVLESDAVWTGYRNTIYYTVLGTLINLFMTVTAAYPLSRKDFWARNKIMAVYTVTMFFGGGMIPTYLLVKNLNMLNTVWAMVIPNAVS